MPGGPENPIYTLVSSGDHDIAFNLTSLIKAKKYSIDSAFSNLSRIDTFTAQGRKDYLAKQDVFEAAYAIVEQDSGVILNENLQDRSFRAGLKLADYDPSQDPEALAWEWCLMDFEYAQTPVGHNDRARYLTDDYCPKLENISNESITDSIPHLLHRT